MDSGRYSHGSTGRSRDQDAGLAALPLDNTGRAMTHFLLSHPDAEHRGILFIKVTTARVMQPLTAGLDSGMIEFKPKGYLKKILYILSIVAAVLGVFILLFFLFVPRLVNTETVRSRVSTWIEDKTGCTLTKVIDFFNYNKQKQ